MTLSTPVKVVALAGLALILGLGGVVLLLAKHGSAAPAPISIPAVHHATPVSAPTRHHKTAPKVVLEPGLPPVVRAMLMHRPTAVVAIYSSRIPGDIAVAKEAFAGARAAHAGFIGVNVAYNAVAAGVATWSNGASDPAVLVVRRPGRIVFAVTGTTDRQTIAQAVLTAK